MYKPLTGRYVSQIKIPQTKRREPTRLPAKEDEDTERRGKTFSSYSWCSSCYAKIQSLTQLISLSLPDLCRGVMLNRTWLTLPTPLQAHPAWKFISNWDGLASLTEETAFPCWEKQSGENALKIRRNVTWNKEADRTKGNTRIEAHRKVWRDSCNISSAPVCRRAENLSQSRAKQHVLSWSVSFRTTLEPDNLGFFSKLHPKLTIV